MLGYVLLPLAFFLLFLTTDAGQLHNQKSHCTIANTYFKLKIEKYIHIVQLITMAGIIDWRGHGDDIEVSMDVWRREGGFLLTMESRENVKVYFV